MKLPDDNIPAIQPPCLLWQPALSSLGLMAVLVVVPMWASVHGSGPSSMRTLLFLSSISLLVWQPNF